jgi:hypothetical protein
LRPADSIIDDAGKILPEVLPLSPRRRFDSVMAHRPFAVGYRRTRAEGRFPAGHVLIDDSEGRTAQVIDFPNVMSKF